MPEWYPLIRAARYLGVAPWVLRDQPIYWRERALTSEMAEQEHRAAMQKRANQRQRGN